tara:strand:- start:39324 stop:40124 length:801 start_codon:yes stop_codon:yes gene_type:complete
MKLIGFTQLRNELSKGNLENWFKCMQSICDFIYIYDQNSDDGSLDYYKNYDNVVVIESSINDFKNEIKCKKILLEKLLKDHPDVDWIYWMDGDTLLSNNALNKNNLYDFLKKVSNDDKADGLAVGHYNLWRSDLYYRTDNEYHWLHQKVVAFWKNNGNISFPENSGLHSQQYPIGLSNILLAKDINLIHKGFSTDKQIMDRYQIYKDRGQSGWNLDRLIDENTLNVQKLPEGILPEWFVIEDNENPINKDALKSVYPLTGLRSLDL